MTIKCTIPGSFILRLLAMSLLLMDGRPPAEAQSQASQERRYLYVATPGIRDYLGYGGHGILVFDISDHHRFVKRIRTQGLHPDGKPSNVKGIAVSVPLNSIYVSTLEGLQRIDLATDKIVWERRFEGGCDRMAISPDGLTMYLPSLESTFWNVVDCRTGGIIKKIPVYKRAHNTIYGRAGNVYLDDIGSRWLYIADAKKHELAGKVGPFENNVRPFTINGRETLAYVTVDSLLGFEVGDLKTGKKLAHVVVEGWEPGPVRRHGNPSHGIGLTPDEKELWLCDGHNMRLHVFSAEPPYQQLTTIPVQDMPGWITFSLDGRYAYPSSGEVIDVKTRKVLLTLKDEHNNSVASEKMVEVQLDGDKAVRAGDQFGIGRRMDAASQQESSVREYMKTFTTYPYSDANPVALPAPVYPYFRYDGFTNKPVQKQWKVVELRNDLITVLVVPEIGGKVWGAIENRTGRSFIYYNGAVKFRDVAMRGPWTSGGLEANYGIIGHAPSCAAPVDYVTYHNNDGSASCVIGTLDLLTRTEWRMEINLPKDKAFFTTRSFWYNNTPLSQPYYHWMNLGMPSKGGLELIFPGTHYIGHEGEYADWPVNRDNGKKINFYDQNDFGGYKSYHVMGKLTHFFGAYYHDDDDGMVRYGTYDDKAGKKIWIWGLSRQGMIWEKMLTDTNGQYVEIQSGRLFNQNAPKSSRTPFKHIGFAPYATDTWTEYWYPVSGIKGMVEANAFGALNIKNENGWLKIFLSAAQRIDDVLEARVGGKVVYKRQVALAPLQSLADSVRVAAGNAGLFVTLGSDKIVYNGDTSADVLHRPMEAPKDFDWNSAYGEYIQGRELMDQKMYADAGLHLQNALKKEGNFLPALVERAVLQYRNMQYEDALVTIRRALQVDGLSGEANYYYGVINDRLDNIADAKDGYSIATVTPEFRSAAYTALARLAGKEKQYDQSIRYAQKAIDVNRYNMNALMLQAVAYRSLTDSLKASEILGTILGYDPLNHFARWEKYLGCRTEAGKAQFKSLIRNELPHETFTELAVWYYNAGYPAETKALFSMDTGSAEAACWLSFLQGQKVDCGSIDPVLAFPFRSETAAVLEHLLKNQDDWWLKYQLALIYRDRGRTDECKALLASCGASPDFAPFYAVRAAIYKPDSAQCLQDLQKALSLDKEQWRWHKLLAEYYIDHRQPEAALAIAEPFYNAHRDQYIMGMLYAKTLLLNKRFREADGVLSNLEIIPFEGATEGRALYREAKLMQAVEALGGNDNKLAAKFIIAARSWPEHLGVGKPYEEDIDSRLEDWLEYIAGGSKSGVILDRILQFNPAIDNTVRNFIPSNALVTAWAMERKAGKDRAISWLDEQIAAFPAVGKLLQWCKDKFEGRDAIHLSGEDKDANVQVLEALLIHEIPQSARGSRKDRA